MVFGKPPYCPIHTSDRFLITGPYILKWLTLAVETVSVLETGPSPRKRVCPTDRRGPNPSRSVGAAYVSVCLFIEGL